MQIEANKKLARELNYGTMAKLNQHSLYFKQNNIRYGTNTIIEDQCIASFWEWNVNVFSGSCKNMWKALQEISPFVDIKYLWLMEYKQLLNFENLAKLLLLFPRIEYIIIAHCSEIPLSRIKQTYNVYFKPYFSLIIMETSTIQSNNQLSYVTYLSQKRSV